MQPWNSEEYLDQSSTRYISGPSAFRGPGNSFAAKEESIRLSNIAKMTEPSYGSPSRFVGKSPNPRDQPINRTRPTGLAFGGFGEEAQPGHTGPKSAPAHVKSFEDCANDEGCRQWNRDEFDDRWHQQMGETRSPTINSSSRQTSHWDLLQAQLGYPEAQSNGHDQNGMTQVTSTGDRPISAATVDRGYECLHRYVAIAHSGQQYAPVQELERLMSTMLELRGDNSHGLCPIKRSGREVVRQYMYQHIFEADDGSSRLSRNDMKALVDVGGELMTREDLHHHIMSFLEDKLEEMIKSPSPHQSSPPQAESEGVQGHRPASSFRHAECMYAAGPSSGQGQYSPPLQSFEALRLAQQQGPTCQVEQGPLHAEIPNASRQQEPQERFGARPWLGNGFQNFTYGPQPPHGMLPQHTPFQQQLASPPGMFYQNPYMPPSLAPMGFYHGGQGVSSAGSMIPYGHAYLQMPQHGSHMVSNHMNATRLVPMPSQQMGVGPFQHQWAHGPSYLMQPSPAQWPPMPRYLGSVYGSLNRAQSPLTRNTDSPFQARAGRNVISEVALLPYRPGSDDMFPYGQQGGSVQFQELTRNGGPTYDQATRPEVLPFAENARKAKPAEWGVLRIGNIPYTLTKQEVLGFLGRNAKIITPEYGVAVHIIMDRPTGKTMDCFIEFFSQGDAQAALNKCLARGSQLRLGDRVVDVHMSSQDELLKELFPRAKNCTWEHGRPKITESTEPYNTGFKVFVTNEELLQTVTWADKPHRFPWFCIDRYTIKTRDELFRSTLSLINILMNELNKANEMYRPNISETLLTELLYAALNVPAFSEQQRWQLRNAASATGAKVRMSPLAEVWPFEVLGRKAGIDEDVVQKYAQILQSHPANTSKDTAFGEWTAISNEALGLQTIGQIGNHEMEMVLNMLGDVLPESL
ncbi:MAG: hypothetical protein Q9169_006987 [Polycauliona sp. 2 TL-2023]